MNDDVFYTIETVFNGRREFPIELSLADIANMRKDPRYSFIGEPVEMPYKPSWKMADCAKWGNE